MSQPLVAKPRPWYSVRVSFLFLLLIFPLYCMGFPPNADQDPFRENVRNTPWLAPVDARKAFELPAGFEIQLVASEPEIFKPLNMAFDAQGRLWITDTLEYPYAAAPGQPARDSIKILEDTNGDGKTDKITTFAEGLNIPIGLLPMKNGCIVFSIPNIWWLEDTNGDGKADKWEILYGPFDHSRDTHGMQNAFRRGFDGWIHACHGFNNQSVVTGKDGNKVSMSSGNTYRFRSDGSRIEHYTYGQVNPFGMAIDPLFNIFTSDCHSKPIYQLLRGGHYPSFGRPDGGLGFVPEMMNHIHGSTAIDACCFYEGDNFPPEYRGNIFVGNVMTSRVNRDRLEAHGSTFQAKELPDLLKTSDPWFRPVDMQVAPDGSLYIADFYNRIIGHYEVPLPHPGRDRTSGRVWRLVYTGSDSAKAALKSPGDLTKAPVDELIRHCDHHTLTTRMLAMQELIDRHSPDGSQRVATAFAQPASPRQAVHLLWVLARTAQLTDAQLLSAAKSPHRELRVHAMKVLDQRTDWPESMMLAVRAALADQDGFVKKAAVEALGTHPHWENLRPLIAAWNATSADDTHLVFAIRLALRDHLSQAEILARMKTETLAEVDAKKLASLAFGLPSAAGAEFLFQNLQRVAEAPEMVVRSLGHIAQFGNDSQFEELLQFAKTSAGANPDQQLRHLQALRTAWDKRGGIASKKRLHPWADSLATSFLDQRTGKSSQAAAELVTGYDLQEHLPRIREILGDDSQPWEARIAGAQALLNFAPEPRLTALLTVLADSSVADSVRNVVYRAVLEAQATRVEQAVVATISAVPERLQLRIAESLATTPAGLNSLLELTTKGKANPRLLLRPTVQQRIAALKQDELSLRVKELTANLPSENDQLNKLIDQRRARFAPLAKSVPAESALTNGAAHFKKHCAACHQVAGQGALIGPQLDGIGNRGWDRLLEDVLDPNRNVDVAFRTSVITLKNGKIVTGLQRREEGESLILADDKGKEFTVAKSEIEDQVRSPLSLMPANVAEILPEGEFFDLLSYLSSLRK